MFKKPLIALAIAFVATASMASAASAGGFKLGWGGHHWGGHHHKHHFIKIYTPSHFSHSCRYYKNKWHSTGYKSWKKKYEACIVLEDD